MVLLALDGPESVRWWSFQLRLNFCRGRLCAAESPMWTMFC